MLRIVFSATTAMAKWLKQDLSEELPRMPSPDGKRIGTQPLVTNSEQISWQCHVIQNFYHRGEYTVIATEAYSRYTLLLPYTFAPTVAEFENELLRRWGNELAYCGVEAGALTEADLAVVMKQFTQCKKRLVWYRNTDMSVNGHISDAGQWVTQTLQEYDLPRLSDEDAFGLGDHINKMFKRAKKSQPGSKGFFPVARLLDDGLFRFAQKLSEVRYPNTEAGRFPNPYDLLPNVEEKNPVPATLPANVVRLASFRKKQG